MLTGDSLQCNWNQTNDLRPEYLYLIPVFDYQQRIYDF